VHRVDIVSGEAWTN